MDSAARLDKNDIKFIEYSIELVDDFWKFSRNDSEKLIINYINEAKKAGKEEWVFFWQSRRNFFSQNYAESLRLCMEAAGMNPGNYYFSRYCGIILSYMKRDEEAIKWYDKAILLNPDDCDNYTSKAISLQFMGNSEEALNLCDKAIGINPSNSKSYRMKGYILNLARKYDEAEAFFKKAMKLNSKNIDTLLNLAYCYEKRKKYESALELYEKAKNISKNEKMKENISDKIKNLEKLWFINEYSEI
ncbi:MAG: tetratricopeptide repeat protein [Clostridia bacterium]|nr:tetratricopeptide repeat protein [Clostridia bacterium]